MLVVMVGTDQPRGVQKYGLLEDVFKCAAWFNSGYTLTRQSGQVDLGSRGRSWRRLKSTGYGPF